MQFFVLAIFLVMSVILAMMSSVSAENYDISITDDMKFNPEDLTINVGDTVTWTNNDGMGHTATSTDGPASFDSGNIGSGGTWSFTFTEVGTYEYKCDYHSSMTATITVVQADSGEGDETIMVNHVALVDTPPHKEWEWNYSYQVEVSDLRLDVNYTAVILIKLIDDDEWGGADWWWDDIEGNGDQYNYTVSLQRECYFINASLYERDDINSNGENATILASAYLDFVVGTGSCVEGVYSEDDDATLQNQENFCPAEITDENKDTVDDSCIATFDEAEEYEPEEGLLSSISFFGSMCVVAIIAFRRKK